MAVVIRESVGRVVGAAIVLLALPTGIVSTRAAELDAPSPSVTGATGLYRVSTAEVGAPHELRLAMYGDLVRATNLLIAGDRDTRVRATIAGGWTAGRHLELFGALRGSDNRNLVPGSPATSDLTGGAAAGVKATSSGRLLGAGLELGCRIPFEQTGFPGSLSAWSNALGTLDLRASGVPLRAHLSAGF